MNMNKEYRLELRALGAQERAITRALKKVDRDAKKTIATVARNVKGENTRATKALNRIAKRKAILQGRLS